MSDEENEKYGSVGKESRITSYGLEIWSMC